MEKTGAGRENPRVTSTTTPSAVDLRTLEAVQDRVLWLATSIVHHANRVRKTAVGREGRRPPGVVGVDGLDHDRALLRAPARAPTACRSSRTPSPVLHAIEYLLGQLDRRYLTDAARVRRAAELSEPPEGPGAGRLLDRLGRHRRDRADLERARAPLRRRPLRRAAQGGRQVALVGDAELDEGACWEAIVDPVVPHLGEVLWIVDLNRQSLDRVVPDIAAGRLAAMFEAAGWHTITVKYGRRLRELFARDGRRGAAPPHRRDAERGVPAAAARRPRRAARAAARQRARRQEVARLIADLDDDELLRAVRDLGGHDLPAAARRLRRGRRGRPTARR